ncbi:ABC transporter ATP-binding protein [Clostridium estertheticum]|uniref:ABC transporter ATP-binding protein n=1 Tax=Clostridium estertheticum TaxID=238834 RepID=UPI001C0BC244|nr:ABC transporter ATP-binding protein [Clostridium estertheticum]MBU3184540.1 ABC transporter ATP-binding protein/permease [Clostridium estertheticum]
MYEREKSHIKLLDFAGKYKPLTILGCILSGISATLTIIPFICIWQVIREIFAVMPNISEAKNLAFYGWMALLFSIASILIYFGALMCTHKAAFRVARNMRSQMLHHIVKLPLGYFDAEGSGKLRRIIDESSGQTEAFLAHQLPDLAGAFVTPIAMLVLLLAFNWRLGLISIFPMAIGFLFMSKMAGSSMKDKMREYQNSLEDMNNEAVEYVRGIPIVKTFQQSIFSFKTFHDSIMRYKKWVVEYTISLRMPMACFTTSINAVFVFLIPAGILLIASVVNYQAFLLDFIFYILFTPFCTVMLTRILFSSENSMIAKDAVNRVASILNEKPLAEPQNPVIPKDASISFEHVYFSYAGAKSPAIDDVSFSIPLGATVALVGPSGGGKTTVASLIPRFWDADSGKVSIGGVDVKNIATSDLMNYVSFVFQDTHLFKTSLLENIRSSKPSASKEEVMKAAKAAQCEEIFAKMPNGIDTVVGTKGVYLSGGEAQRISLARAILKDAPIVLLDEATAFADPENEHQIYIAFEKLTRGKTVLMIAHRLSTIKNADCIMILKNGKIVEQGVHDELIAKGDLYAKMWKDYQSSIAWKVAKEVVYNG